MKPRKHTNRHESARSFRASSLRVASCGFVVQVLLVSLLLVPGALNAQSGRKRPDPAPTPQTPNTQRARRANPTAPKPSATDLPGQPPTPDEQRGVPAPTPTPILLTTSDPETGQAVEIDPDEVIRVNSNLVPIPASVIDDLGRAISDLEVKDFELRVDGQPRPIGDVSRAETPVRLALLFDNSYSLRAARELEKQSAMRFFRTVIRPVDQAAIYSVSTEPILEQAMTGDVSKLMRVIDRYGEPEGATALLDTIVQAADYLRPQTGRKVIVIVSDGVDTVSNTDFAETVRRVQSSDCQVYAVQNNISENQNLRDLTAESRLRELTTQTGGAVFAPKTTNDLPAAFAQISADLAQQYVLSYYPNDDRRDGRFRIISLRVKTRTNARVRARRGYYPHRSELTGAQAGYTYNPNMPEASALTNMNDAPPDSAQPSPASISVKLSAPAVGPSYGSKNLNPDADDDAPSRRATPQSSVGLEPQRGVVGPPAQSEPTSGQRVEFASTAAPPAPALTPTPAPLIDKPPIEPAANEAAAATTSDPPPANSETNTNEAKPTAAAAKSTTTAPAAAQPKAQPSPAPTTAQQPPVSGVLLNGRARKLPPPLYPETALRMRVTGAVNVEVTVDENGKVIAARAISGPMLLRDAAVAAARQADFTPTLLHDKPVQVTGVIVYKFSQ